MMKISPCCALLLSLSITVPVSATTPATADAPSSFFVPLTDLPGVVSWTVLARATTIKSKGRLLPAYPQEIALQNNRTVKVQGFMMPLEPGQKQKHFLLTVTSSSCPYCLPAGPEGAVEIRSKTAIKFTYAPLILSGKMSILKDDPMGLFYRLTDASPVEQ